MTRVFLNEYSTYIDRHKTEVHNMAVVLQVGLGTGLIEQIFYGLDGLVLIMCLVSAGKKKP